MTAASVAVTALVVLAGRLPRHAKLGSDLRPSEAQMNCVVDQHRELRVCFLLGNPDAPDPLQHLAWRKLGNRLRRTWRFPWLPVLYMLGFRLALGPAHVQHAVQM